MPNLTDVLYGEDEPTVEDISLGVGWARDGSNQPTASLPIPTGVYLQFTTTTTATSGFKWIAPNGTWAANAIHGTGYVVQYQGTVRFEIREDAKKFAVGTDGMYWDNYDVVISRPVPTASKINNIMELTQAEYDALSPNYDQYTLYVING